MFALAGDIFRGRDCKIILIIKIKITSQYVVPKDSSESR